MQKSKIAISIAVLSGILGWFYFDTTKTYDIDGWCLTVDTAKLPEYVRHVNAVGPFPKFDLDIGNERTVRLSVSRSNVLNYVQQIEGKSWVNCPRRPFDYELQEIEQASVGECGIPKSSSYFEPTELEVGNLAVLIECSENPLVINCSLDGIKSDGWKVRISLPREDIGDWVTVAERSQSLFDEALLDCGDGK